MKLWVHAFFNHTRSFVMKGRLSTITSFFIVHTLGWCITSVLADVACQTTENCIEILKMEGTECIQGKCTNPFYQGGCLSRMLPGWKKLRTCNSDDPPSAVDQGFCKPSPLGYREVRIANQNWDSAFLVAWIQQIILSEILDIPVTIETGSPLFNSNLYDINASFGYGTASDLEALRTGYQVGDCQKVKQDDPSKYKGCSHAISEYFLGIPPEFSSFLHLSDLGFLVSQNWYIPKFTGRRDPSLTSYLGLSGEENRRKLAERFLRPTSWKDYCNSISETKCAIDDGVATRPPADENEGQSFFSKGSYIGHFRPTEKNNCDLNPQTCTGHIGDYPCYFSASVVQNAYHLNISLESDGDGPTNGYSYNQLWQIWDAANATKSDVIMIWWQPESLYEEYVGSDAEFTKVVLPPPTQNCLNNKVTGNRCGLDLVAHRGKPEGACDAAPRFISSVISSALRDDNSGKPVELQSPAFETLSNFRITALHIGQIFEHWFSSGIDKYNFDPRWATCQWVVDNIDHLKSFVPVTHPRRVETESLKRHPLFISSLALSNIAICVLAAAALFTRVNRKTKAVFYAQEPFLYSILSGLALVVTGSLLLVIPPSNATCIATAWLVNIGYAVALLPFFVRINTLTKMLQSGKKMQRVRLKLDNLFGTMACFTSLIVAYLVVWMLFDAPQKVSHFELTDKTSLYHETIVREMQSCGSDNDLWMILSFAWQGLVLLTCLMLVFTALSVKEDINDTRSMAVTVVWHSGFFLARLVLWIFSSSIDPNMSMGYLSLLLNLECLIVLMVYFVPKLIDRSEGNDISEADPDLFLYTTIIMVEIAGFSAWSSVREPVQVFKFLEIVHGTFDDIADKRQLFKVETSGGCYVAAAGIPRAQTDHMLVASRFAWDCMRRIQSLTSDLEMMFGPDTSSLTLRIGIHSGPVTGGYLKGTGARFQLFGDTVNTAVQLVRSCEKGRIQISSDTAKLLSAAGKARWVQERADKVQTTTRGRIQTYWLKPMKSGTNSTDVARDDASSGLGSEIDIPANEDRANDISRQRRLIEWNVSVLHKLLKQIVARHSTIGKAANETISKSNFVVGAREASQFSASDPSESSMPLDEVKEIIALPAFDYRSASKQKDIESVSIPQTVEEQLNYFVTTIAQMYRDNPFHNFFHASHVVMAVTKFMNRINEARELDFGEYRESKLQDKKYASALHDHTYGITSDPLTQFACVFSALIHDVDHPGVPNPQLIKENKTLAATYRCRSVAEQNSFDLAWNLFTDDRFRELRGTICTTSTELLRFRQLVINSVMATDLGDKELKELRNGRWAKAFHPASSPTVARMEEDTTGTSEENSANVATASDTVNRKATIVVEHLIQAADVSHTTQHWEVYRVWNENLFRELYKAYIDGRSERNPADFWYEGEIGFFDYYIIPLAKKLRDCGVFGLTSDENLNYAMENRQFWQERGVTATAEMLERAEMEFGSKTAPVMDKTPRI